jgi:hypothetical protein
LTLQQEPSIFPIQLTYLVGGWQWLKMVWASFQWLRECVDLVLLMQKTIIVISYLLFNGVMTSSSVARLDGLHSERNQASHSNCLSRSS